MRVEAGVKARVPDMWINAWCTALDCTDEERRLLLSLAAEMRVPKTSSWRAHTDEARSGFNHYRSLEAAAKDLTIWSANLIPDLLQTPDYRRAIASVAYPVWTPEKVERHMREAAKRQNRLHDLDFAIEVFLWEAVLRGVVGSAAVLTEQLTSLLDLMNHPTTTIRVVPFKPANPLRAIVDSFVLLEFPKHPRTRIDDPPVVYAQGYAGELYLESKHEVEQYRQAINQLSRTALSTTDSRDLILTVAREYTHE